MIASASGALRPWRDNSSQRTQSLRWESNVYRDVRIVAATNKNPARLVKSGKFLEDLYFRIRVIHIKLPELKDKQQAIPCLNSG